MASRLERHRRVQYKSPYAGLLPSSPGFGSRCLPPHGSHAHGLHLSAGTAEESHFRDLRHFGGLWFLRGDLCRGCRWPVPALGVLLLDWRYPHSYHAGNLNIFNPTLSIEENVPKQYQNGLHRRHHHHLRPHPHYLRNHSIRALSLRVANTIHPHLLHSRPALPLLRRLYRNLHLPATSRSPLNLHHSIHDPSSPRHPPPLRHLGYLLRLRDPLLPNYHVRHTPTSRRMVRTPRRGRASPQHPRGIHPPLSTRQDSSHNLRPRRRGLATPPRPHPARRGQLLGLDLPGHCPEHRRYRPCHHLNDCLHNNYVPRSAAGARGGRHQFRAAAGCGTLSGADGCHTVRDS